MVIDTIPAGYIPPDLARTGYTGLPDDSYVSRCPGWAGHRTLDRPTAAAELRDADDELEGLW